MPADNENLKHRAPKPHAALAELVILVLLIAGVLAAALPAYTKIAGQTTKTIMPAAAPASGNPAQP